MAENRRRRTQRNKIVTALTGLATASAAIEQAAPAIMPSGSGVVIAQLATLAALLANIWWPK